MTVHNGGAWADEAFHHAHMRGNDLPRLSEADLTTGLTPEIAHQFRFDVIESKVNGLTTATLFGRSRGNLEQESRDAYDEFCSAHGEIPRSVFIARVHKAVRLMIEMQNLTKDLQMREGDIQKLVDTIVFQVTGEYFEAGATSSNHEIVDAEVVDHTQRSTSHEAGEILFIE